MCAVQVGINFSVSAYRLEFLRFWGSTALNELETHQTLPRA